MAGLMNTGATKTADVPMRSDGMAADAPRRGNERPSGGDQPNVSPEEQAQYDQFVNKGFEVIYDKRTLPQVLDTLKGGDDPQAGLANATAMVVMRLEDSAKQAGKPIPPDVVFHGGVEILEDLANLASEAGIHDFSEEEIEGALYQALDVYRSTRQKQGELDEGAIKQDFSEIVEADRQGRLGEMVPGLEKVGGGKKAGMR